jgi:hypothetical protein
MLANHTSILFSREPDILLLNNQEKKVGVIEVKGVTDPAGALEGYGTAKKSFEEALCINPEVQTILIANCITPEDKNRIENAPTISTYFNLTEILRETLKVYDQSLKRVFSILYG